MGTGGPNPAAGAGLALISPVKLFRGDRHISKLLDGIAFDSYNDRFGGGTPDDPNPWLTTARLFALPSLRRWSYFRQLFKKCHVSV